MRVGLIGCGIVTRYCHLPALRRIPGAVLVAVADPDARARATAGRISQYERADDLLERDDIDGVVISVPTGLHADVAFAATAAGKHFYLEKPIATRVEDARRVADAAARAGVGATVGFNRRAHPLHEQARGLIQSGRLGRVRAVQTAFCEPVSMDVMPPWKRLRATGGGVLLDLASHHIDLLRWFLDDEVAEIRATMTSEASEHDSAHVQLAMCAGVEVQSFFSFRAGLADVLEFLCERGTLRVDRHRARLTMTAPRRRGYGLRSRWIRPSRAVLAWWPRRLLYPSEDPSYYLALRRFIEGVKDHARGLPTLTDGVRGLEAIVAAEASADRRGFVRLARE